jgi:hypothetical protein
MHQISCILQEQWSIFNTTGNINIWICNVPVIIDFKVMFLTSLYCLEGAVTYRPLC